MVRERKTTRAYYQGTADSNRKRVKHGGTVNFRQGQRDPCYHLWLGMRQRCFNPKSKAYPRYGGRGVTICEAWGDYAVFRKDVGEPPEHGMTLERIDNNGNYEPGNVRWATRKEQANNRATNVVLTWKGKSMTLKQWAEHLGWKYGLIASRWKKGLRDAELFAPRQRAKRRL